MRLYEIITEAIQPVQPVQPVASDLDQTINNVQSPPQQPRNMKAIIDYIRKMAGNQPVQPTKNPGLDKLLFKQAALSTGPGALANVVGKGLNRIGSAFAAQSGGVKRIASFDRPMRSGAQMRAGLDAVPDQQTAVSTGQQQSQGLNKEINPIAISRQPATEDQVEQFLKAAAGDTDEYPVHSTRNQNIDRLLKGAGIEVLPT